LVLSVKKFVLNVEIASFVTVTTIVLLSLSWLVIANCPFAKSGYGSNIVSSPYGR
jgi:hypothetical protein